MGVTLNLLLRQSNLLCIASPGTQAFHAFHLYFPHYSILDERNGILETFMGRRIVVRVLVMQGCIGDEEGAPGILDGREGVILFEDGYWLDTVLAPAALCIILLFNR